MKLILGWAVLTLTVVVVVALLPGLEVAWSPGMYSAMAVGFAVLNVVLAWALTALSVPLKVLTWGSITFVLNAIAFLVTDLAMGSLQVDGLWPALIGAAVLSFVDLVIEGTSRSFRTAESEAPDYQGW